VPNTYTIKRVSKDANNIWKTVKPLAISEYPWNNFPYKPETETRICYTDVFLRLRFDTAEENIRAIYTKPNSPVCTDSCVEFFVNADPENSADYVNFEVNPIGTMLAGIGEGRHGRTRIEGEAFGMVSIEPFIDSPAWGVELTIPFAFLEIFYGKKTFGSGRVMKGNLYKCGDRTKRPHYGCWSRVGCQAPDFHRPEYFGDLLFE